MTVIKPLGGTEVTFAYDGMLRRIRMSEGATHTYFRHDAVRPFGTLTVVRILEPQAHGPQPFRSTLRLSTGGAAQGPEYVEGQSRGGMNLLEIAESDGTVTKLTHGYTRSAGSSERPHVCRHTVMKERRALPRRGGRASPAGAHVHRASRVGQACR